MDSTGDSDKQEKISLTDVHIDKFGKATEMQNGHMTLSQRAIQYFRKNLTLVAILTGVILGFTTGLIIRLFQPSEDVLLWIGLPGELFLRLLILMIAPLIICSVISGTAGLDPRSNGKIASVAFIYIFITNLLGALIGVLSCLVFKPGEGNSFLQTETETQTRSTSDVFADLFRNIFPDNIVKAAFSQAKTATTVAVKYLGQNATNATQIINKTLEDSSGTNILGLIVFSTMIGIATSQLKKQTVVFIHFFDGATEVILLLLKWISWLTPFGVLSLIAVTVARIVNISDTFAHLGLFVAAVTVGVGLQHLLIFPLFLLIVTRQNPYPIILQMAKPWLLVVATTMTAIAIPGMLQVSEEKFKIDKRVSRFVIPFSTTINANGSACFIASGAIFLASASGMSLSGSSYAIICLLSGMSALAVPSTPSAGIVAMLMVLTSFNIPLGSISLLFAVEWFLDRIRSGSNCISDMVCCCITYHFCRRDLMKHDLAEQKYEKDP